VGLAFLLFLSGLEIDVDRLRGRIVTVTALGFAVSFVIAILIGISLRAGGFVKSPLFVAIVLVATSLGVVFPVLKDSHNIDSSLGQLVITAASIAEFGSIILLSLFFSGKSSASTAGRLILLGIFEAVGFGVFIPIFFVTSGLRFDLSALFASSSTIARVPLFLLAILLARGLPALGYLPTLGLSRSLIAGILQATTLPFIVAATQIGLQLGVVSRASAAGLVAAGLLSVVISPALGLALLRREHPGTAPRGLPTPVMPVLTAEDRALCRANDVDEAA